VHGLQRSVGPPSRAHDRVPNGQLVVLFDDDALTRADTHVVGVIACRNFSSFLLASLLLRQNSSGFSLNNSRSNSSLGVAHAHVGRTHRVCLARAENRLRPPGGDRRSDD
jgi:hypothetical protein